MTAVADPPTTTRPPRARRPRMRRPAHEPEAAGASATAPGNTLAILPPPVRTAGARAAPAQAPPDGSRHGPDTGPFPRADDVLRRHATATVRAMVEVLAGRRVPAHLAGIARPEVVRYLTASRTAGPGVPVTPARVHVSRPGRDAAEIVAVCRFGARFRALAVRLDREPGRGRTWCATAVRLL